MAVVVSFVGKWDGKDLKRAQSEIEKLQNTTDGFGGRMQRAGDKIAGFGRKTSEVGGSLAKNVTLPIIAGGVALVAFAKGAEDAEIANRKLGAVLDSMGYPEATSRVSAYAEELERSLAIDADVIKATQTKLATFKNLTATVGEAGGAFDRATLAALDLAAAGFGSAETNAVQLGKALQDPVKGITALGRAGVTFTEQEKEKIKALVESGRLLEAQNIVLGAIEGQVGGTAAAGASSFERIKLSLMQVADAIGMAVLPLIQSLADFIANTLVPNVVPKIEAIISVFTNLPTPVKIALAAFVALAAAIGPVLIIAGKIITLVGTLTPLLAGIAPVAAVIAGKVLLVVAAIGLFVAAFKLAYDNSEFLRNTISQLITTVVRVQQAMQQLVTNALKNFIGGGIDLGNILRTVAQVLGVVFGGAVRTITGLVEIAFKAFEVGITVLTMVANVIRGVVLFAIDALMNKLGPVSTGFRAMANGIRSAIQTVGSFVSSVFNNIGKAVETFINFGIKAVNALIGAYNKLADILPGVSRASLIAEFRFGQMSGATGAAASSANNAANAIGGYASQVLRGNRVVEAGISVTNAATTATNNYATAVGGAGGGRGGGGAAGANAKAAEEQKKFNDRVSELKTNLENAIKAAKDYAVSVADTFVGQLDLGKALEAAKESGRSIVDEFIDQGKRLSTFAENMKKLLAAGLNKTAFDAIISAGAERGADIADALAKGNIDENVRNVNEVYQSVGNMGVQVGQQASSVYMTQGIVLAQQMLIGFIKEFMPAGKKRRELLAAITGMVNEGLASLSRLTGAAVTGPVAAAIAPVAVGAGGDTGAAAPIIPAETWQGAAATAQIAQQFSQSVLNNAQKLNAAAAAGQDVTKLGFTKTDWAALAELEKANVRAFATGGLVMGPTLGLVGEAGPELIVPLDRLGKLGGTTIQVTVNAGMGTNGPELGRQIVDALKQYERRNGPVYVSA